MYQFFYYNERIKKEIDTANSRQGVEKSQKKVKRGEKCVEINLTQYTVTTGRSLKKS
jgi:hypothetical protein